VLCAFTLAGCGIAAKVDARTNYQKSVEDYRACLADWPTCKTFSVTPLRAFTVPSKNGKCRSYRSSES
jgi:hypothetical protein